MIDNKNAATMIRRNSLLDEYDLGKLPLIGQVEEIQFPRGNGETILITDKVPIRMQQSWLRFAIGVLIREGFYDNNANPRKMAIENLEKLRINLDSHEGTRLMQVLDATENRFDERRSSCLTRGEQCGDILCTWQTTVRPISRERIRKREREKEIRREEGYKRQICRRKAANVSYVGHWLPQLTVSISSRWPTCDGDDHRRPDDDDVQPPWFQYYSPRVAARKSGHVRYCEAESYCASIVPAGGGISI